MATEIVCIEWKSDYGKKFSGFFIEGKNCYRRVSISTETFNFPKDSKIHSVILNEINGQFEKYDKSKDKIFGENGKREKP